MDGVEEGYERRFEGVDVLFFVVTQPTKRVFMCSGARLSDRGGNQSSCESITQSLNKSASDKPASLRVVILQASSL